MLNMQNNKDKLFVLLFLYNKYIKINLPTTEIEVAVYGITFSSESFILLLFTTVLYLKIDAQIISQWRLD